MKITRIKPPKYKIGKFVLNEYELRNLMVEVAMGYKNCGILVRDENGNTATICKDGSLDKNLSGTDLMSRFTLDLLKERRERAKFNS